MWDIGRSREFGRLYNAQKGYPLCKVYRVIESDETVDGSCLVTRTPTPKLDLLPAFSRLATSLAMLKSLVRGP